MRDALITMGKLIGLVLAAGLAIFAFVTLSTADTLLPLGLAAAGPIAGHGVTGAFSGVSALLVAGRTLTS